MLNDSIKAAGLVQFKLLDQFGNVKDQQSTNLVVNTGLRFIAESMLKTTTNSPARMTHMAVGSGTNNANASDTALQNQLARIDLDSSVSVTTSVTNDAIQYIATFAAGTGTGAITEAGIFNDPTAGSMLCRTVFPVINKGALDTLVITWKVTIA
jgi:hypothetical protein